MAKGILQFDLPEDRQLFEVASRAGEFHSAAHDFANEIRSKLKYEKLTKSEEKVWTEVRSIFFERFGDLLDH